MLWLRGSLVSTGRITGLCKLIGTPVGTLGESVGDRHPFSEYLGVLYSGFSQAQYG